VQIHHLVGLGERPVRGRPVAVLPVVDVVVGLAFLLVADDRGARLQSLVRVDQRGERFVVDVDQLQGCLLYTSDAADE